MKSRKIKQKKGKICMNKSLETVGTVEREREREREREGHF